MSSFCRPAGDWLFRNYQLGTTDDCGRNAGAVVFLLKINLSWNSLDIMELRLDDMLVVVNSLLDEGTAASTVIAYADVLTVTRLGNRARHRRSILWKGDSDIRVRVGLVVMAGVLVKVDLNAGISV